MIEEVRFRDSWPVEGWVGVEDGGHVMGITSERVPIATDELLNAH